MDDKDDKDDKKTGDKKKSEKAYFVQRLMAFIIDILLVTTVASLISVPFVDSNKNEKLTKQADEIIEKLTKGDINNQEYIDQYVDLSYNISRENGMVSLITIILNILYFVVYQIYNKGQTIGKKIMRIRIESDTGELFMNQMIFRSFIANFILVDIISFMFMLFSSKTMYFFGIGTFQFIQYIIVIVSVFMILFRKDGCAIHDKLVHTKVVRI